ncbi:MAG TPA: phosphoenolpyruvate--protein phosphotransferase [Syntrophobacteraceae bacterium]|nr:phosphoenolpyruvate--protein phosphotransferase [Syntrophobacteraceae bacterium]
MERPDKVMNERSSLTIKGIGAAPGIAIGKAYLVERGRVPIPRYRIFGDEAVADECKRFKEAVAKAESDLEAIKKSIRSEFREHARLLEVQQLILRDPSIYDESLRYIEKERANAQLAVLKSLRKAKELFNGLTDEYARSRIADVNAAGERVIRILAGQERTSLEDMNQRAIIIAHDLTPADAIQLQVERVLGVVTEIGGTTSHTSIVARALNIPAAVGAANATRLISTGDILVVDGATGTIIVDPSESDLSFYSERQGELEAYVKQIRRHAHLPAETLDAHRVSAEANVEVLEEVVAAKDNGAEGIGLYRTEFFFMNRVELPDEEALYRDYREMAELMAPSLVTIRTLDLGAEKLTSWYPRLEETNPALGLRSIRLCLHYRQLFKTQLRAILRASAIARNIKLMLPMVSGIAEVFQSKRILKEVQAELSRKRIPFDQDMAFGVMIEVPSAVALADLLAQEVDFFSIGTNDLIQYTIGIDRSNEHVHYLYEPLHPGVLRFIKQAVDAGHGAGIPVALCGEMAGEPMYVPVLLGLSIDSFSMNPVSLPRVKNLIRRSSMKECCRFVSKVLRMRMAQEVDQSLTKMVMKNYPEEFRLLEPLRSRRAPVNASQPGGV